MDRTKEKEFVNNYRKVEKSDISDKNERDSR